MNVMLLLAICISLSMVSASSDEYRLRTDIAQRYDDIRRDIVPSAGGPLQIDLGLTLIKIVDFNEDQGSISIYGWQTHSWQDKNLVFDSADYGGITSLRMPSDKIWRPDIYQYSSLTAGRGQGESVLAFVDADGTVLFVPPTIETTHCDPVEDDDHHHNDTDEGHDHSHNATDESYHYHHEWICEFKFGSWVYDGTVLSLGLYGNKTDVDTRLYKENTRYELASTSATVETKNYPCCTEPFPAVRYELHVRRK